MRTEVETSEGTTGGSFAMEGLRFSDGEKELFGLDALTVDRWRVEPGKTTVGNVELRRPRLRRSNRSP